MPHANVIDHGLSGFLFVTSWFFIFLWLYGLYHLKDVPEERRAWLTRRAWLMFAVASALILTSLVAGLLDFMTLEADGAVQGGDRANEDS